MGKRRKPKVDKGSQDIETADGYSPMVTKIAETLNTIIRFCIICAPIYMSYVAYDKWGLNFFIPSWFRDIGLSPQAWQLLLGNHTILLLGGPHRGGTTILWKTLREHPQISDFGDEKESGFDLSEGVFIQDVYPQFSISYEWWRSDNSPTGLGRYALAPEEDVHWTHDHPSVTETNQARLLNRYGYYWDFDKPVLLEKSPTNAVLSTFLQSLINQGNTGWTLSPPDFGGKSSVAKFVFISRHPVANSYAHMRMKYMERENFRTLVENWLAIHEYLEKDIGALQYVRMLRLEDFELDPEQHLVNLWKWIGLDGDLELMAKTAAAQVRTGQNTKYQVAHCRVLQDPTRMAQYDALIGEFNERIKALSIVKYDMNSSIWGCRETTQLDN